MPQDRGSAPADYWLSESDCWNMKGDFNVGVWKLDGCVVTSLKRHAEKYNEEVFLIQEQETRELPDGSRVETKAFIFALCPKATLKIARARLHGGCVFFDATFGAHARLRAHACAPRATCANACTCPASRGGVAGLNAQRYSVSTLMLLDEHKHGLPFAHVIHSSSTTDVLTDVINALSKHMGEELVPKFVLVDDADNEIGAVRASHWGIKGCKVALCIWHVKRSWLKNVIAKLPGTKNHEERRKLFGACGALQLVEARQLDTCAHARS